MLRDAGETVELAVGFVLGSVVGSMVMGCVSEGACGTDGLRDAPEEAVPDMDGEAEMTLPLSVAAGISADGDGLPEGVAPGRTLWAAEVPFTEPAPVASPARAA